MGNDISFTTLPLTVRARLLPVRLAPVILLVACQRLADTADPSVQMQIYETAVTRMAEELRLAHPVRLYPWLGRANGGHVYLDRYDSTTVAGLHTAMDGAVEACTLSRNGRCAGDAPYIVLLEFEEHGVDGVVVPMLFEWPLDAKGGAVGFVRLKLGIRSWGVVQVRRPTRPTSRQPR